MKPSMLGAGQFVGLFYRPVRERNESTIHCTLNLDRLYTSVIIIYFSYHDHNKKKQSQQRNFDSLPGSSRFREQAAVQSIFNTFLI